MSLAVAHLSARRGARTVLTDVSFTAYPAEILGVIGPNGAGKTTLFECVAGLLPRMMDFENNVLLKLRRSVPEVRVVYPLAGRSGLFENDAHYGEIVYRLGMKTATSRSTTEEIVLDTIYGLAGMRAPARPPSMYPGYPLAKRAGGAGWGFYVLWPAMVVAMWRSAGGATRTASPRTDRTD